MRLIVTGAAGFIGSVLCTRAVERRHIVLGIDDLSRGLNGENLLHRSNVHFLQHDCQGGIYEALSGMNARWGLKGSRVTDSSHTRVDAVVHFAAGTGSLDRPLEELRGLNVEMTKRVYGDAKALGAKVFVYPTTSLALGVPDSPYVQSKEEAFQWLLSQSRRDHMKLLPLRFFNVVGAYKGCSERRKHEVHLVPRLVDCYVKKEPFTINGSDYETVDGTPSRTYTNVLDVVDFILEVLEVYLMVGHQHPDLVYQDDGAVWVGTTHSTTTKEVYHIFQQWVGEVDMRLGPRRAFDCAALLCAPYASSSVAMVIRRPLAPAWVGIRDEALELLWASGFGSVRL